jgi:HD-GYP domain-containing protein (c-di-GMP phosphodiesterase class II)
MDPRHPPDQAAVERLIAQLAGALTTHALYPPTHPAVEAALAQLRDGVVAACDERRQDALTFIRLDDELVVDSRPLRSGALFLQPFIRALRRSDVARLTLSRDLDLDECRALVGALATGRRPDSTARVLVGQVEIAGAEGAPAEATGAGAAGEGLTGAQVDMARDLFARVRHEGAVSLDPVEELVWGLADAVARSTQAVLPTVPLKSHDEYTFVHSVNVSLLVLAQARGFGFEGALLHTIGVAALLHDVGKLRVPLDVLNKAGKLSGDEWRTMASHAELGAWELAALGNSAPMSILVAYEHHLRYDGEPNYPAVRNARIPTLASQLTAIADVYDAICTVRPYRRALSQAAALDVLRSRAGTFHDPYLVGQFCQLVTTE